MKSEKNIQILIICFASMRLCVKKETNLDSMKNVCVNIIKVLKFRLFLVKVKL